MKDGYLMIFLPAAVLALVACSAVQEATKKVAPSPAAVILEARKVCIMYELGTGPRDQQVAESCAALLGECSSAPRDSGAGGAP